MTKQIYVAGKFFDRVQIRKYMDELECMGFIISHDWCTYESNSSNRRADMARLDINGVKDADIVVILMTDPKYAYRGSFTELGTALALNKTVYIICDDPKSQCCTNVFFHHPNIIHLNSWPDFLDRLTTIHQKIELESLI